MADVTSRWNLPLIAVNQAQKDVTHNEALITLDAFIQNTVQSRSLNAPPMTPLAGQSWIVASGGSGEWAGQDNNFALYTDSGWRFVTSQEETTAWVLDEAVSVRFRLGIWQTPVGPTSDPVGGSVVDVECRAAVIDILAALRNHGLIAT